MNKVKIAESTVLLICLTQSSIQFRMSSECAHNGTGSGTPSSGWGPLPVEFPMAISYWCHQEEEIDSLSLSFQELRSGEQIAFISFSCCSTVAECSCKLSIDRVSFMRSDIPYHILGNKFCLLFHCCKIQLNYVLNINQQICSHSQWTDQLESIWLGHFVAL